MIQAVGDVREGFICPQCHQDMSTMEMLQAHFEDVHAKQPSSTMKGLLSLAKQKIKSVQDNLTVNTVEQPSGYAQFFSYDSIDDYPRQIQGFSRSFTDQFIEKRKEKLDQLSIETTRLLLRLEQLTSSESHVPKNRNTKERRKYEQEIVPWVDESKVSLCPSCAKSFGLVRRKHHCRLDGFVICNQCSEFLPFPMARYLIEPNGSLLARTVANGVTMQRSNSITSLASTIGDETFINSRDHSAQENYLRICLSCRDVLQRYYNHLSFKNIEKDDAFLHYEKIVQAKEELQGIHPRYSTIVESLLSGDTKYKIADAQQLYRQLSRCYEKIDSTSKLIARLGDNCPNIDENDTASQIRYGSVCRNIRMYAVHMLQNYAISTRRVPTEDDVQRAREERQRLIEERNDMERAARNELESRINFSGNASPTTKTPTSGWRPTVDRNLLEQAQELEPLIQQIYQVTQFIHQAQIAGRHDEVESLKSNLKELQHALNSAQTHKSISSFDS